MQLGVMAVPQLVTLAPSHPSTPPPVWNTSEALKGGTAVPFGQASQESELELMTPWYAGTVRIHFRFMKVIRHFILPDTACVCLSRAVHMDIL